MTLNQVLNEGQLLKTSAMPLAAVLQPFADVGPRESAVPFVECGEEGPVRCGRCRGYINPFARFMDGSSGWSCNLCGMANSTRQDPPLLQLFSFHC